MAENFLGQDFSGILQYNKGNQYPVMCQDEDQMEGAQKRFVSFPTVQILRAVAMIGLRRLSPEGYAEITDEYLEHILTSTISELEMKYNCIFSPTEFFQSFDYIEGMFAGNFMGLQLLNWPATGVLSANFKFPHSQTSTPIQNYELPPQWIALLPSGRLNVLIDFGTIAITSRGQDGTVGMFGSMTTFLTGVYRPSSIEIHYRAGFAEDRFPAVVADWIITLASIRLLSEIGPILFPYSSVSVSHDSVSQTSSLPGPAFLLNRIQLLTKKEKEQRSAIKGHFGKNFLREYIGS